MTMVRCAVLCVLFPLLASAAAGGSADPVIAEAQADARQARALAGSPRAIAWLVRMHALRDELPDLYLLAQTYADLAFRRSTHPDVRHAARMLLAEVERARGRLVKAHDVLEPLGFVQSFYVLGAFDNEGKSGCDTDFGPEARLDLSAVYPTRERETGWRRLELGSPDGYVDLASVLRPNHEAVGYALTFLEAPADTRVDLSLGTSGAFKLWVNDELALSETRYNQPRPDQARVQVTLRKGLNRVLLKVCQSTGPFGFYLRQQRAEGAKESAHPVLPPNLPPLEKGPKVNAQRLPDVPELLARELTKHPDDAQLRGDYATLLGWYRTFDETTRQDSAEADRAAEASFADAGLQLLAADGHDDDPNLQRRYLTRALAADPKSVLARIDLARLDLDRSHPERALEQLDGVLADSPGSVEARLLRAEAYALLDQLPRSVKEVEDTFLKAPEVPIAAKEAARSSRRLNRPKDAIERYRVVLALRHDDQDARHALASLLADTGRIREAADELRTALKLAPFDNNTRVRLAELLAANGRLDEGLELFAQARALCPDEPELYEREGRALLQAGRRDRAIAAFTRALELRPQNPPLREALRALQGADASYGAKYVFDLGPLMKEAEAIQGEDAVYLVDYSYTRVQASGLSSSFHQVAVKVYTQRGVDAFRTFPITYSPDRQEVQVLRVRVTRPDGSVSESFGDSDRALNEPWTGMYYDARARELSFPSLSPGDVLELQYRIEDTARDNLLSDYYGYVDYVQTTAPKLRYQFMVDMPQTRPLFWNKTQLGTALTAEQTSPEKGRTLYAWRAQNVPKIVPEPSMPGWSEVATTLHVSTYKAWNDVGRYWWGLVRDQLTPNEELRRTVDQVLSGVDRKDELAVVRAIYDFVVTHTRYVALEFGIHGYKPYRVDRILARRFGDCKDKASLIHAMLEVAGVDSRLVLLRMRNLGMVDPEPASLAAFNHAIAYIPKFDLYLDGTAAFHGSSELPTADRHANALIVEPDGTARFLTTPEANAKDNLTRLTMEVTLKPGGEATLQGDSTIRGVDAPEYRRTYQTVTGRKSAFERGWAQAFPGVQVKKLELSDLSKLEQPVQLTFEMEVPRYSEVLDEGLRFYPFGSPRAFAQTWAPLVKRQYDLDLEMPWTQSWTFRTAIPEGSEVGELPANVDDETPFGYLRMHHRIEGGAVISEAELAITTPRIRAKDYPTFRAFLTRVDQAFARKVVMRKVEPAGPKSASR
ncbi:MAG: DUF3857 domain-containing protein [Myxococcaceae bacterium]|nr:DUF3857 domain-containing protein [Myxococcaceae bacterium]